MEQLDLGTALRLPMVGGGGGSPDSGQMANMEASPPEPAGDALATPPQLDLALAPLSLGLVGGIGEEPAEARGKQSASGKRKFEQRSADLCEHMRNSRAMKHMHKKIEDLQGQVSDSNQALNVVTGLLPDAAALIGRPGGAHHIGKKKKGLSPAHFVLLVRAAFLKTNSKLALGIKHKRLVCAVANFLVCRQTLAMSFLLRSCQASLLSGAPQGILSKGIHVSYTHVG